MLSKGFSVIEMSDSLVMDPSTVYRYGQRYQQEELSDFLESGNKGYWGLLPSYQMGKSCEELKQNIHTDSKPVARWIRQVFGVEYTQQGVVDLLNRIGYTYKKTKEVPCECNVEKQQAFLNLSSTKEKHKRMAS